MKENLINYWRQVTTRTEDKSVIFIIGFAYFMLLGFWNSFDTISSWTSQLKDLAAMTLSVLIAVFLYFSNFLLIAHLKRKESNNFSWYLENLYVLGNKKIWDNNVWWKMFLPIQIVNFILSVIYPEKFLIWLSCIPVVLFGSLLLVHLERYKVILSLFLGNILFAISVFTILNFRLIGVYFYWFFTGHDCFINYGYDEPDDPLTNVEFFWQIRDWEAYENPLPSEDNQLKFSTHFFWNTVLFHLYPIIFLLILFNSHYLFGKVASLNLGIEKEKI